MSTRREMTLAGAAAASVAMLAMVAPAGAEGMGGPSGGSSGATVVQDDFERRAPDEVSPSGNSVEADCGGADEADGWTDARARLRVRQRGGGSDVTIRVRRARPDTYYTVWLRLGGMDSNGDMFGGNPLTGGMATALAHTDELPGLLATTPPYEGSDEQPNGFRTNHRGNAVLRLHLDFPIVGGAYPFQRFEGFNPSDPALSADTPALYPVAVAGPMAPYTLRIVSHCTDDVGHGLKSGDREWWFDWTVGW